MPTIVGFTLNNPAFSLLDVHPESIESAKAVVATLGLASSVASFETVDASAYRVCPDQPPGVILIEMMQACLEAEPQVAITRHLRKQSPNAILIPEEVGIDLTLVDLRPRLALPGNQDAAEMSG